MATTTVRCPNCGALVNFNESERAIDDIRCGQCRAIVAPRRPKQEDAGMERRTPLD